MMTAARIAVALAGFAACTPSRAVDASPPTATVSTMPRTAAMPTSSSSSASSSGPASKAGSPGRYAKPSDAELRAHLTPLQYKVTQNAATEPPFRNAYWDNHEAGIYVDVATGEPLFSSLDKFESGTGWPSFTKPIEPGHVDSRSDSTLGMERTEVLSRGGGSHLGHVFDDGPAPTGMRYCINSAALRFVPVARLSAEGYGDYAARFESGAAAPPPADSSNACAVPPPGERPGCTATLAIAVFARSGLDDGALGKTKGVLDVAFGRAGGERAVQVTFDPSVLSFADLLAAAGKEAHGQATVYPQDDDQRSVAKAAGAKVVDAVAFRGE